MAEIIRIDSELISGFRPERQEDGHKNTFGTTLICAGSEFMTGAAVLACGAALRSGAGLVRVFSEEKTLNAVSCIEPCALLELRPEGTAGLQRKASDLSKKASSVLIGPGIPTDYGDMEALTEVFLRDAANIILDAGALAYRPDVLSRLKERLRARAVPAVITPHAGEFARMLGVPVQEISDNGGDKALCFAAENNCIVVLKSYRTLIAVPGGDLYTLNEPNSGLAKGGSGDVLAGLAAGFLAQGMEPYKAACSAVFIHSKAGRAAADDIGEICMLPADLLNYLPEGYLEAGWSDGND
ncbi:MAG: NAD(P)H-hydrate dehydratase [Clostridiales bacterium]|nr:NAD(P)H-hydrate dehydratase [Clostridiales bacterium]